MSAPVKVGLRISSSVVISMVEMTLILNIRADDSTRNGGLVVYSEGRPPRTSMSLLGTRSIAFSS